ncbi:MAG: oxygen-independent coproporphyrinogen III oxidase [Calditrichaeota bacterium]|nr:oxygen-independent coproporphyrinogen III oxidase [Calditrichota bacterium]MCB9369837.1 oxygen-independent coproporphyrinogen III oxidase [Calditrichota bacterium]
MIQTDWRDIPEEQIFSLIEELDIRGPRYTSYPTVPVWKAPLNRDAFVNTLGRLGQDEKAIAVYLHLPFCRQRCLYCGCNAHITHDDARMHRYMDALETEIRRVTSEFKFPVKHSQLHLGGGTPTYVPTKRLAQVLDLVIEKIPGAENFDRSIEVDPRVTTDEHLDLLAERGFTRISAGLQDLNADVQAAVRREYTFQEISEFIERARVRGFQSVNIDLIYGLPRQTRDTWRETVASIATLRPDRLACFGYAHLPARMKHQRAINEDVLPSSRDRLGMLLDANRIFGETGYAAIGMDHFALPDDDLSVAQSQGRLWRNFMGYTTTRGLELLGLGCSGISEFTDLFAQNIPLPEAYATVIEDGKLPLERGHELSSDDRATKQIINHLMCNLDVALPENSYALGEDFVLRMQNAMQQIGSFEARGLVTKTETGYRVTPLGQLFVRNLAMPFDRYLGEQANVVFSKTV